MIKINNLTKLFNEAKENQVTANSEINLSIKEGEIVGLLGITGGKNHLGQSNLRLALPYFRNH